MRRPTPMLLALLSVTTCCAVAQQYALQTAPQTKRGAPTATGRTSPLPGRNQGRKGSAVRGGSLPGGTAITSQSASAANGNASVGVLGDSNGDGLLDRDGRTSTAALPGIAMLHNAMGITVGTPIHVRLQQSIDSGLAHNGDTVRGTLDAPLGKTAAGAPVTLTVVAAAAAGILASSGVLSLQVTSVNGEQILSQIITAEGKEGPKLLPSDAPGRGTEAVFSSDQPIILPAA